MQSGDKDLDVAYQLHPGPAPFPTGPPTAPPTPAHFLPPALLPLRTALALAEFGWCKRGTVVPRPGVLLLKLLLDAILAQGTP